MVVSNKKVFMHMHTILSMLCSPKRKNYPDLCNKLNSLLEEIYLLHPNMENTEENAE
jgi:hypothetical protein